MEKIAEKNETYDFDELTKEMEEEILEEERGIYFEKTLEEVYNPKNVGELEAPSGALGGLPEENIHCSVLAMDTLRAVLEDYKNKNKKRNKKREEVNI